jgi:hypothetical protein
VTTTTTRWVKLPPAARPSTDNGLGTWEHHRGRVAYNARIYGTDAPETENARRDLRAARLAEYIRRTIDVAPPLTGEQRDRLALLLRPRSGSTPSENTAGGVNG